MLLRTSRRTNGKEQILDPPGAPLLFWFSSLSLSFHSFTVSHAEQLQEGRFLKKKKTKASKATKASKGASSSGKGGKATSQPSEAPSVVPTIGDPCQAAFEASSCGGVYTCACIANEREPAAFGTCCVKYTTDSAVCVALLYYYNANCIYY